MGARLKFACFDKTGTLTENDLDLWGVVEVDEQKM
jgi:magnesium-transporting ATPase (P-type)